MNHTKTFIFLALVAFLMFACSEEELTPEPQQPAVPQIILDTDIASSTDDLFTMQLLYRYAAQGRCKLLGVVVDREGEDCAALRLRRRGGLFCRAFLGRQPEVDARGR
jgi:hypothetical protein